MRLVRLACHVVACLPVSAAAPASCAGTLLPNGLCIPAAGPQGARRSAPPVEPTLPPYLSEPPAAINISLGRQLFVDPFLLLDPSSTRTTYHEATWLPDAVMGYDEPWESWPLEDAEGCATAGRLVTSRPYSGGLWTMPDGSLRLYYLCAGKNATGPEPWARLRIHTWTGGLCLATSHDSGQSWQKPQLPVFAGTNIVLTQVSDGITVWRDDAAPDPKDRWVAAAVPEANGCMAFALWSSADGIHWTERVPKSGPINDRSTICERNPCLSLPILPLTTTLTGRHRSLPLAGGPPHALGRVHQGQFRAQPRRDAAARPLLLGHHRHPPQRIRPVGPSCDTPPIDRPTALRF